MNQQDQPSLDELWSGTVTSFDFDLAAHRCVCRIRVLESGVTRRYTLAVEGIMSLAFTDQITSWEYIELTSITAQQGILPGGAAGWRLALQLWDATMDMLCERWLLTRQADAS